MTFLSRYGMMCKCWALDPCNRPSFSKLVSFMCDQLTDREEKVGPQNKLSYLKQSVIPCKYDLWAALLSNHIPFPPSSFSSTRTCSTRHPATTRMHRPSWTFPPWQNRTRASRPMTTVEPTRLKKAKRKRPTQTLWQLRRSLWSHLMQSNHWMLVDQTFKPLYLAVDYSSTVECTCFIFH